MRLHLNMSDNLVKEVDKQAEQLYMTRSAFITMCVVNRLQSDKVMNSVELITRAVDEFKNMSDEQRQIMFSNVNGLD